MNNCRKRCLVYGSMLFAFGLIVFSPLVLEEIHAQDFTTKMLDEMTTLPGDLGVLPPVPVPKDNPQTKGKITLGKMLFFDTRLSRDYSMSCATCHAPDKGYSDNLSRTIGFGRSELGRHSPTVINTAYNHKQFWDGRANSLEEQAKGPIMAAGEMNTVSEKELIKRLNKVKEYRKRFKKVFGEGPKLDNIAKAIAAFERTVVTKNSPFDQYVQGDKKALSEQEKRGLILFFGKASCVGCHNGPNFTDNKFHNLGLPQEGPLMVDHGRFAVTKDEKDKGKFKTPTLRNVAQSAPYMHDGSHRTLEEVVEYYNQGGGPTANKSELVFPLNLTKHEVNDVVALLNALTGELPNGNPPKIPPVKL